MLRILAAGLLALAAMGSIAPAKADVINTLAGWNGTDNFQRFGLPNTATFGQTFIAPAPNAKLQSLTFGVSDLFFGTYYLQFRVYVATWDGTKAGPILYTSPDFKADGSSTFQTFTADVGGLPIDQGQEYVWFLSESEFALVTAAQGLVAGRFDNPYPDGRWVHFNNGDVFDRVTSLPWDWLGDDITDLAFIAEFSVPAPSTIIALLSALTLYMPLRQRARRASA